MTDLERDWHGLHRAAELQFLRPRGVLGVALAEQPNSRLVFFLERDESQTVAQITDWARAHGVAFEIKVTGAFQLLG
jgi:hypothetical protein